MRNINKINISIFIAAMTIFSQSAHAISWDCDAKVTVHDRKATSNFTRNLGSYTIPQWRMSTSRWIPNREKDCGRAAQGKITPNLLFKGGYFDFSSFSVSEKRKWCAEGLQFRISYTHSARSKYWNKYVTVKAPCYTPPPPAEPDF